LKLSRILIPIFNRDGTERRLSYLATWPYSYIDYLIFLFFSITESAKGGEEDSVLFFTFASFGSSADEGGEEIYLFSFSKISSILAASLVFFSSTKIIWGTGLILNLLLIFCCKS